MYRGKAAVGQAHALSDSDGRGQRRITVGLVALTTAVWGIVRLRRTAGQPTAAPTSAIV